MLDDPKKIHIKLTTYGEIIEKQINKSITFKIRKLCYYQFYYKQLQEWESVS